MAKETAKKKSRLLITEGKAVSSKNVTISANKIIEDYQKSLHNDEKKVHGLRLESKISDNALPEGIFNKRLDRCDRPNIIQDACFYDDMEDDSLKQIDPEFAVTYTYLLNTLHRNKSTLNLRNHGIGPEAAIVIKNTLIESGSHLGEIDMSSNKLLGQGTAAICQYLAKNDSVVKIDFSRNALKKDGVDAMAQMLSQNACLKHLVLSDNELTEEHFKGMAEVLHSESVLEYLDLSRNYFSSLSGYLFGSLFAQNTSLVNVNLSCNRIGDDGIYNLAPGLIQNCVIRILDLSWNDIGDEGARWLAELLITNNILQNLNISYNQISSKGTSHIAKSLAINTGLTVLDLNGNNLSSGESVKMLEAVCKNSSTKLTYLYLGEVVMSAEFENVYKKLLKIHPDFIVSGMVNATGQPIKMTSTTKIMKALTEYFEQNKFDHSSSYIE